ncbi:helix-turn-helix domain-containing protein [Cohnella algarum]|uniref:helix-turn-helix domain-containing protein n=1 Tax=Cohnella algarum TaxID=2044859 RepID=UPI00196770C2|nr:helix-turn-helix domain-containing protein [Cohnella algarum]MBN2984592.1 helix-turn-helix transcriptional regulator [Cohnella algarum]
MLRFMQLLQRNTIRPYIRYAHHMVQAVNMVPRIIFDHEFVWIEQGAGSLAIGSSSVPYRAGDLLLIPPGTVHKLSGPFEAHKAIHFDWEHDLLEPASLDRPAGELQSGSAALYRRGSIWLPRAVVFRSVSEEIAELVDDIVKLFQSREKYRQLQLQVALCQLLLRLIRDVEEGRTAYAEATDGRFARAEAVPEENGEMAELANLLMKSVEESDVRRDVLLEAMREIPLSEPQIRRQFKRQYGYTPNMYLTLLCMNKARRLLAESRDCVQDIAFACGYADPKYFSRQFRRIEGVSPAAFRALQQK